MPSLSCPRCAAPMEEGILGTTGVLSWQRRKTRLLLDGEILGKKRVATTPNYPAWRCRACHLVLIDHAETL
ncbi:MAG: PF20097 family protein [Thermoplasmata archaeon]